MSRTDLDPATLARMLRRMAGDGSVEWVMEPIQAAVLHDIADLLDENDRLRSELESVGTAAYLYGRSDLAAENAKLRELVKDIHTLATDCGVYVQYPYCDAWDEKLAVAEKQMRELGVEV